MTLIVAIATLLAVFPACNSLSLGSRIRRPDLQQPARPTVTPSQHQRSSLPLLPHIPRQKTPPATAEVPEGTDCVFEVVTDYVWQFSFQSGTAVWQGWITAFCPVGNISVWDLVMIRDAQGLDPDVDIVSCQSGQLDAAPSGLAPELVYWSWANYRAEIPVDFDLRYFPFDKIYVPLVLLAEFKSSSVILTHSWVTGSAFSPRSLLFIEATSSTACASFPNLGSGSLSLPPSKLTSKTWIKSNVWQNCVLWASMKRKSNRKRICMWTCTPTRRLGSSFLAPLEAPLGLSLLTP